MPVEDLVSQWQRDEAISNKTSVFLETSSVRRVLNEKMKNLKEQEKLKTRCEKLRRKAKQCEKVTCKKSWLAKPKEPRWKPRAKGSSSCGSIFQSISPVEPLYGSLTKVSVWLDKTEEVENGAQSNNVPSVYPQTSV